MTVVMPGANPEPFRVTTTVLPGNPVTGVTLVSVSAGFVTVNEPANVAVPPPGAGLETVTSLTPGAAPERMFTYAVAFEALSTFTLSTVIPVPENLTVVMPLTNPRP